MLYAANGVIHNGPLTKDLINMRVALASDHAGFELKEKVATQLRGAGFEVMDLGTGDEKPVDYADFALAIGEALRDGRAERGILICGSGVGACVAANKINNIRAGLCHDTYSARQGVEHDDMNVLCLGSRVIGEELAKELVSAFLAARFTNEERHARRLAKVEAIEKGTKNKA
jgi:RpiB/LacA/LacB family sugar-phosphate isomerase